jgi:hypothetical protein
MTNKADPQATVRANPQLRTAFKIIIALTTFAVAQALVLVWIWRGPKPAGGNRGGIFQASAEENVIRKKFPEVNFSAIYPDLTDAEIDRLQRACLGLRYVYSPFIEFAPLPVTGRFVNITPAGFRKGRSDAPWPPAKDEFIVFVFGGSTAFGFGLPDGQTVVSALEENLGQRFPGRTVRCYNFGRGYYFSAQERQLFESLLGQGFVPNAALFIDGLNDFIYYDGVPQLTPPLFHFTAPDLPAPQRPEPANDVERAAAAEQMIMRYQQNVRLTQAVAREYGVSVIFVGQPVPFLDFPMQASTYPFKSTFAEHRLAGWGYGRFKQAGREGRFGERFVWCGNAFAHADRIMYVDSIHYSRTGAEILAKCIVERAAEAGLLP